MTNVAYIDTTPDEWDRGPDPKRAREIKRLERRYSTILDQALRVLTLRTHGADRRLLARFDKLGRLHAEGEAIIGRLVELDRQ